MNAQSRYRIIAVARAQDVVLLRSGTAAALMIAAGWLGPPNHLVCVCVTAQVPDSGGVYFVPAFSGLLAPHWDDTARGAILGLTGVCVHVPHKGFQDWF